MFNVLTELEPTRYWLVCQGCERRWPLVPDQLLLPQTRLIFAEHGTCPELTAEGVDRTVTAAD